MMPDWKTYIGATTPQRLEMMRSFPPGWFDADPSARPIDGTIIDSAIWLLDRLPAAHAEAARSYPILRGGVALEWETAGRALDLEFESPHSVNWFLRYKADRPSARVIPMDSGTLNLAMNLQEIADLVRRAMEGG